MEIWDPERWLDEFNAASFARDREKLYQLRQDIIWETKSVSENGGFVVNGKTVTLSTPPRSTVYSAEIHLTDFDIKDGSGPFKVQVINKDCLEVAREYADKTPLVLNMANRQVPGGGVEYGAGAQEECLFRSSNYFQTLYPMKSQYPLDRNYGGIYSPEVTVFRGVEDAGYPLLEEPFKVNFIAVVGINRPPLAEDGHLTEEMYKATERKVRTILNIAVLQMQKTLILSALGCGAFKNPPEDIAEIFKEQLSQKPYCDYFETVIFAIKTNHRDTENLNFRTFERILG